MPHVKPDISTPSYYNSFSHWKSTPSILAYNKLDVTPTFIIPYPNEQDKNKQNWDGEEGTPKKKYISTILDREILANALLQPTRHQ